METDFSQAGLFPAQLKGLSSTTALQTWPPPSLLLAREECVALPGLLAAAPPRGSEIRTMWWSEGSQDSAGRQAALLSGSPRPAALPGWADGQGAPGDDLRRKEAARTLPLKLSTALNSRPSLPSLALLNVSCRDFWDSLVLSGSRESWEKR